MFSSMKFWVCSFLLTGLSLSVFGSNVVVFPAESVGRDTILVDASSFTAIGTSQTVADGFLSLTNSQETRTYVLGKSGTVVVLDTTAGFSEIARYSLASPISAAVLTPDGKKLLVTAGELRIIDLSTDIPARVPSIAVGALPTDVAISLDSKRAYVASVASRTLSAVDLTTNSVIQQIVLPVPARYVSVSPSGLIYVSGPSRLFEYDDRSGLTATIPDGIAFEGDPGKPQFTFNGKKAVMLTAQSELIVVDLATRATETGSSGGLNLDQLAVVSDLLAYARGADGRLYQLPISTPGAPSVVGLPGLPRDIVSFAASHEASNIRYLFAATSNQLYRIDLGRLTIAGPISSLAAIGTVRFNPTPSLAPVAALQATNVPIVVAPGANSYPLALRAVDANGLPVANATVIYSSDDSRVALQDSAAQTNINGIAATRAVMPFTTGQYVIRATSNGVSANITVSVAPQVGEGSTLTAISGEGQIIATTGTAVSTSAPYQVKISDQFGNLAPAGTVVTWEIRDGIGVALTSNSTSTDGAGIATVYVQAGGFTPQSFDVTRPFTIRASIKTGAFVGALDLHGVVYPSQTQPPQVSLINNVDTSNGEIVLSAGSVISNAFTARIITTLTSFPYLGIPNVGVRVASVNSATPPAACQGTPVSNTSGVANCNLVVGANLGPGTLRIVVADSPSYVYDFPIRVTPGAASKISIIQGDGQSGAPGSVTPKALVIHVVDPFGNPLRQASVTWNIVSGDASLVNPRSATDNDGNASTQVKFGGQAGSVTVRATSGNVSVNFTLTNGTPVLRLDSVLNGASFLESVAPCSVTVLRGVGFTSGLNGVVSATPNPALPYTLSGVTAQVGGVSAPIFYVSNVDGIEQIGIQTPCEIPAGSTTVSVTALGQTVNKTFAVKEVAPGIFETEFTPGLKQGVVIKANGTYVSPQNPAIHNEVLTGFFNGLVPSVPPGVTNTIGQGQTVDSSRIIIGIGGYGMPVVSAQYAADLIGVYTVQFKVEPSAGIGNTQVYAVAVSDSQGQLVYGQNSTLPIKSN